MTLELISRGHASERRPSLLFIPGGFHDARCWDHHFLPWFAAQGWAAHAVSLRGHGNSPGNLAADKPGLDDFAQDVEAVMARIGGPVVLIGHSMGGVLAQMVRASNKNVVGAVLLASSPLRASFGVAWRMLRQHPIALIRAQVFGNMQAGMPAFVSFFYGDDLDPVLREKYIRELCGESPRAIAETFRRSPPQTPDLATRPVLVVAGRDDWSIPMSDHEWLAKTFKAPLKVVPGAHNLMVDPAWQQSAEIIKGWLTEKVLTI